MNIIKYLTNKKYRFFTDKVSSVEKTIWDAEFKINKSRQIREGVRQDRDRAVEAINQIETQLKTAKKEEKAKLEEAKTANEENVKRYEGQMKMIDDEINGGTPTEYSPDGIGLLERIKSYVELKQMYKEHAKGV